jgi:ribosomal protein S18 acetylase RimI-like enzyme
MRSEGYKIPVQICWWKDYMLPGVLDIIDAWYEWEAPTQKAFLDLIAIRDTICMVCYKADVPVGFMVYRIWPRHIEILFLMVHPDWQKGQIGTQMIHKLQEKLSSRRRNKLTALVSEDMTGGHLFLQKMGFRANKVLRNGCYDGKRDGYLFVFDVTQLPAEQIDAEYSDFETQHS